MFTSGEPAILHEWLRFEVTPQDEGRSLGAVLRGRFQMSRGVLRRLKAEGEALLNGKPVRLDVAVTAGDIVALRSRESPSPGVTPEDAPLDIIYEDEHLLVVNKPSGMVVHPARRHKTGTLAGAVAFHLLRQGHPGRVRPVNRLDRETSGLVVFAKSAYIHERLARDLDSPARGRIVREYVGLAVGCIPEDEGTIAGPIKRVAGDALRRMVAEEDKGAQAAATHFCVLCRWPAAGVSLVRFRLETGRTHQIRVHMAHKGHPLVGDTLYGDENQAAGSPVAPIMPRTALHARRVDFRHPLTHQPISLVAPLPADFLDALATLNRSER